MTDTNPYQAYTNDSILNSNPLGLVVALYEGAIESSVAARRCVANRDIPGRTKAINKIINILAELMCTLNDEKGGEVSQNLRRLYIYIQSRVLESHLQQKAAPLEEVEKLLSTILEGWKGASVRFNPETTVNVGLQGVSSGPTLREHSYSYIVAGNPYENYMSESGDFPTNSAYAF